MGSRESWRQIPRSVLYRQGGGLHFEGRRRVEETPTVVERSVLGRLEAVEKAAQVALWVVERSQVDVQVEVKVR